jgi:hypothetical protein
MKQIAHRIHKYPLGRFPTGPKALYTNIARSLGCRIDRTEGGSKADPAKHSRGYDVSYIGQIETELSSVPHTR